MNAQTLIENLRRNPDFIEIHDWPDIIVDLRYGSSNNFMNKNIYGEFTRAFLHREAAAKLEKAHNYLNSNHPGHRFLILDALRPRSAQHKLWEHVYCTDEEKYVANPNRGSMHNFGFSVDLTILDPEGKELDMGAGFDDFREIAEPRHEEQMLQEGRLTPAQLENRLILRRAMEAGEWQPISIEWWHFDAAPSEEVRTSYQIIE